VDKHQHLETAPASTGSVSLLIMAGVAGLKASVVKFLRRLKLVAQPGSQGLEVVFDFVRYQFASLFEEMFDRRGKLHTRHTETSPTHFEVAAMPSSTRHRSFVAAGSCRGRKLAAAMGVACRLRARGQHRQAVAAPGRDGLEFIRGRARRSHRG
jgi:hypothetical protein